MFYLANTVTASTSILSIRIFLTLVFCWSFRKIFHLLLTPRKYFFFVFMIYVSLHLIISMYKNVEMKIYYRKWFENILVIFFYVGFFNNSKYIFQYFSFKGLAKYTDLFVRHEVDLQTFATLTEQDLREIGIQTFGARKKLLLLANSKSHFFYIQ